MSRRSLATVILCLTLLVSLSGASSCNSTPSTIDFTILHTNDIHSHLRAERATSERNPFNLGGLAKLKTLVDRIRGARANTLLLDAGDWSEGIMPFAVDGGTNMLKIMDKIGYDAVVVGNHDFLNGVPQLGATIERAGPKYPVLGANKDLTPLPDHDRLNKLIPEYTVLNVGGVRVGVIGLLTEDLTYYEYFKPGVITGAADKASAIAKMLHDQKLADVIVLLSHNTFDTNVKWGKVVPWVNVVISGHSHLKTPRVVTTTNAGRTVYIAETKQWGQFLGDMQLTFDRSTGQTTLKNFELHPVSADLADDPGVLAMVQDSEATLAAKFGHDVVGDHAADCTDEMVHDDNREVPVSNLQADAYREATGADVAMDSVQLNGEGLSAGVIHTQDIFNMAPHIYGPYGDPLFPLSGRTWTLKNVRLSGSSIKQLVNVSFLAETAGLMGHIALSGARVTYVGAGGGLNPLRLIEIYNRATNTYAPIDDQTKYVLAMHDGLLLAIRLIIAKLGLSIDLSDQTDSKIESWLAVLSHITSKGVIHAADYEAGSRYHTTGADLGFYEHDVQVVPGTSKSGYKVLVTVKNEGLQATQGPTPLRVLRSAPNDIVNDATPDAENTPISGDVNVPVLAPGARTTVEIPWDNMPGAGLYSLKIQLQASDANDVNNVVIVHRQLSATSKTSR